MAAAADLAEAFARHRRMISAATTPLATVAAATTRTFTSIVMVWSGSTCVCARKLASLAYGSEAPRCHDSDEIQDGVCFGSLRFF